MFYIEQFISSEMIVLDLLRSELLQDVELL